MRLRRVVAAVTLLLAALSQQAGAGERLSPQLRTGPIGRSVPLLYVPYGSFRNDVDVFKAGIPATKLLEKIPATAPYSTCVDAKGNLYEADEDSNTVYEYARGAKSPSRSITTPTGFFLPSSIAVTSDGSIYLVEENINNANPVFLQLDRQGKLLRDIQFPLEAYGSFAIDTNGTAYLAINGNVEVFPPHATKPSATISEPSFASGLAIDSKHELLVGMPEANAVAVESLPSGKVLRTIATIGAGDYIALDEANDYLYAVSASGRTLQWYRFDDGRPLGFLAEPGLQVAVDPGT
jgi:DNA-binding beta-propeller fold protein YncE